MKTLAASPGYHGVGTPAAISQLESHAVYRAAFAAPCLMGQGYLAGSSGYVSRMCSPSQRLAALVFGPLLKPDCKRLVKDPLDCVCC